MKLLKRLAALAAAVPVYGRGCNDRLCPGGAGSYARRFDFRHL